jgi:hypothetical protein
MSVWLLAEEGRQYLVFSANGRPFALRLHKGEYIDNVWIDARTGSRVPAKALSAQAEQVHRFLPSDRTTDWVLILRTYQKTEGVQGSAETDPEVQYTRTILDRSERIVDSLGLEDLQKALEVRDIIAQQYRSLRDIHDTRDLLADRAGQEGQAYVNGVRQMADHLQKRLHDRFIQRLSVFLDAAQIDKVKDGMTYGLVQVTYDVYLKMLPGLTDTQKARIMALLVEARELAMDAGSAQDKHAIFNRYKGKINNYLSSEGYDLKKASQSLR